MVQSNVASQYRRYWVPLETPMMESHWVFRYRQAMDW